MAEMRKIDITKMNATGQDDSPPEQDIKTWWTLPEDKIPGTVNRVVKEIRDKQTALDTQRQISARLYGNQNLTGVNGLSFSKIQQGAQQVLRDRISYNVVESCIDTITAKIAKNRPKPLFLTDGGNYKTQRKAKRLNKFVEGIFYENKVRELSPVIFRDCGVWGDGIVQVYAENKRVRFQRVMAPELYVDPFEAFHGNPRQMHRATLLDRGVVLKAWGKGKPELRAKIENASTYKPEQGTDSQNVSDVIQVTESWHLPSGPGADDGMHCITIEDAILMQEPWKHNWFPFARVAWKPKLWGYWSMGIAESIQNIQLEINKLLWVVQRSMHLAGTFKIAVEAGSKIVKEHLNNDVGTIINYAQNPPQYLVPPIVQPEIYQHLERLIDAAYEVTGISQLSANAEKPAGLDSGKALREYNDIESDRFNKVGQQYENFHLELARLAIETAKDIAKETGEYKVKVPGSKFLEVIDWKDIKLEEDSYVMQVYPISSLPNDPQGRLQTVQEYIQAGFLDPFQGQRLLDFPDLDAVDDVGNAPLDWIYKTLDAIVDGDYEPPDPYMNLAFARKAAQGYYAMGNVCGLEDERLDDLRTFMDQIDQLMAKAMPQPDPGMGAPAPQAAPMPPPQSDLIPNVPSPQAVA